MSLVEDSMREWSVETDSRERDKKCLSQTDEMQKLSSSVTDWTGTVSTIYRLGSKAILAVRIGRYTRVRTSYNESADASLIDAGTSVFDQTAVLQSGEQVRFSGSSVRGSQPCIFVQDAPGVEPGAEVLFKFTALEKE
jgi:hypothetical protein